MECNWYEEIFSSNEITQGDIIKNCQIPILNKSAYVHDLQDTKEIEEPITVWTANLIIMTQACDLAHDKLESILLCAVWTLKEIAGSNNYFNQTKARENLRQGREPAYHLLKNYETENYKMDFSVVDFHRIYTLPKEYIKEIISKGSSYRLRLHSPYREHLSQAFARYFMRVGLPQDISKEEVETYMRQ